MHSSITREQETIKKVEHRTILPKSPLEVERSAFFCFEQPRNPPNQLRELEFETNKRLGRGRKSLKSTVWEVLERTFIPDLYMKYKIKKIKKVLVLSNPPTPLTSSNSLLFPHSLALLKHCYFVVLFKQFTENKLTSNPTRVLRFVVKLIKRS
jgi:hypothetical protein